MKTKTHFRKFRSTGEVIALFPEIPVNTSATCCESYMHTGQHGGAYPGPITGTVPATPDEYAPLMTELRAIGYDPAPVKRITYAMHQTRRAAANPATV